jgi:diguanylate cyclase (GGDEF)-like protein/PAS domain S-box-containing protein
MDKNDSISRIALPPNSSESQSEEDSEQGAEPAASGTSVRLRALAASQGTVLEDTFQAEINRRDRLLQVIAEGIGELLLSESVSDTLPRVLAGVAQVVSIDRMQVRDTAEQGALRTERPCYVWSGPNAPPLRPRTDFQLTAEEQRQLQESMQPLFAGHCMRKWRRTTPEPSRRLMHFMGVVSSLLVPVRVRGKRWGFIAFDDCHSEHHWSDDEVNALKVLAGVIGGVITRERSLEEVRARDGLLAAVASSAHEIMTAPLLQEAIANSLERVARIVRADRMFVLEISQSPTGASQLLHRNSWHTPETPLDLAALLGAGSGPEAEAYRNWSAPLSQGEAVVGSTLTADAKLKSYFARLKLCSTLLVPIMADGKYWGQIGFDACREARDWAASEIGILKTLAELIGASLMRERYISELANANAIVQNSPTILFRLRGEPSFPMIYISQNIKLLGHDPQLLLCAPTLYHGLAHPDDRAGVQAAMAELLRPGAPAVTIEHRLLTSSGVPRWVENRCTPVRDSNGRLVEIEGILVDVTERKAAEEKIALLARTDVLTGLPNRATFDDRLRQAFAAACRGGAQFSVLYLDLDRFKEINDTLGHGTGDKLLQEVAARLRAVTRESDVAARLGGDEFAILQTNIVEPAASSALAAKVIAEVSSPYLIDGNQLRVGVSVGISPWSAEVAGPERLIAQADRALYRAKEEGRGQYRFHSPELDAQIREHVALAEDLRRALDLGQLEIYYQPQVELSSGRITGMEALIRWNHPERGLLLPNIFLPIAERSGLSQTLGRWVLEGSCRALRHWRDQNMDVPVIAVNVDLAHLRTGHAFINDIQQCLKRYGLEPRDLELDVTEMVLARVTLAQNDVLEQLHELGVRIAIDDFGTQYSSLDYLRIYHVSRLKIARPVVGAATRDRDSTAMVRGIMSLASELGIEVVAEGVETDEQRRHLLDLGAETKGQGHLFSTALPADEAEKRLRKGVLGPSV